MSLKFFHICFVSIVTVFFLGYSTWAFYLLPDTLPSSFRGTGYVTLVAAVFAVIYGIWFYRKAARIIL